MNTNAQSASEIDKLIVIKIWALSVAFERRLAADLAKLGLSVSSFRLIGELMREPNGVRQSELARRLGVRPPSVSSAVTRMEQDGLVIRVQDPRDPRARLVLLAPNASLLPGREILGVLEALLVRGRSESDREQLAEQLEDLRVRLESGPQEEPTP